MSQIKSSF
jgi:NAD(P)-dependent dehydrogenase (short-subunit alcohol dehydrogenase family)